MIMIDITLQVGSAKLSLEISLLNMCIHSRGTFLSVTMEELSFEVCVGIMQNTQIFQTMNFT